MTNYGLIKIDKEFYHESDTRECKPLYKLSHKERTEFRQLMSNYLNRQLTGRDLDCINRILLNKGD